MTMPNFLIIGAQKSGTSSLYNYVKHHPEIYMSPVKEPGFFAIEGASKQLPPNGVKTRAYTYTHIEAYEELFDDVTNETGIGEASAVYLHKPGCPERIKKYIPDAKLVAIIRDPGERAFSNYLMSIMNNLEKLEFRKALEAELNQKKRHSCWWANREYLLPGFYYEHLSRFFDNFPENRIKVILFDDLANEPLKVLTEIYAFLGVDPEFLPDTSRIYNQSKIPRSHFLQKLANRESPPKSIIKKFVPQKYYRALAKHFNNLNTYKPGLSPDDRKFCIDIFRKDIEKLQGLVNRDLSAWLKVSRQPRQIL